MLKNKNLILESEEDDALSTFNNEDEANIFYYIGRIIENKGPQTEKAIEKYLKSKFGDNLPSDWDKNMDFFSQEGRKLDFDEPSYSLWLKIAKWHESKSEAENPNAKYSKMFWDWYKEKKAGKTTKPDNELIKFFKNTDEETIKNTFEKYYSFAVQQLADYINVKLSDEEKLIKEFWDWHRAKKAGKPYQMPETVINGMLKFLKTNKALEVMQQYYYYAVRVIEKLSDTIIKTPVNLTGLQKELKRIMDNLDNEEFVDELEKIEINRLHGGDMTAGPVFILPKAVITSIRDMARDKKNVDSSKIGKIDKTQVKECYVYCINELNRKFHIGRTGIFDLNIQDFYDTYKIVFQRGFNTKTLHKIFDEVCQYLLDQLDKGTAEYWKNRGQIDISDVEDFNEAKKLLNKNGYVVLEDYNHYLNRFNQMNKKRTEERNKRKRTLIYKLVLSDKNDITEYDFDKLMKLNVRQLQKLVNDTEMNENLNENAEQETSDLFNALYDVFYNNPDYEFEIHRNIALFKHELTKIAVQYNVIRQQAYITNGKQEVYLSKADYKDPKQFINKIATTVKSLTYDWRNTNK